MVWKRRQETDTNCCTFIDEAKIKKRIKRVPVDIMKEYGGVEV